jgi:hypothetical protein
VTFDGKPLDGVFGMHNPHFRFSLLLSGYSTVSVNRMLWLNEPEVPVKVRV